MVEEAVSFAVQSCPAYPVPESTEPIRCSITVALSMIFSRCMDSIAIWLWWKNQLSTDGIVNGGRGGLVCSTILSCIPCTWVSYSFLRLQYKWRFCNTRQFDSWSGHSVVLLKVTEDYIYWAELLTKFLYAAVFASRLSGVAAVSAVENQWMVSSRPSIFRDYFHQRHLCFQHVFFADKTDSVCHSKYYEKKSLGFTFDMYHDAECVIYIAAARSCSWLRYRVCSHSKYVSIHRNTLMSKSYRKHYVSSFPAYTRQFHQFVVVLRHLAVVLIVFQLIVAVALSAQTTDKSVNQVTPDLFAAYPDAFAFS